MLPRPMTQAALNFDGLGGLFSHGQKKRQRDAPDRGMHLNNLLTSASRGQDDEQLAKERGLASAVSASKHVFGMAQSIARQIAVSKGAVTLADGKVLPTETVLWTAGVKANPIVEGLSVEKDKLGRVIVDEYLELPQFPGVFALGDCAHFWDPRLQTPLLPTAQAAVQQARAVADNIARALRGQAKRPFLYRHQGDLVSLGSGDGVGEIGGVAFSGLLAWLLWRAVFLGKLIGWKNRIRAALDWIVGALFERDISKLEW